MGEVLWYTSHALIIIVSLFGIIFCVDGIKYVSRKDSKWKEETKSKPIEIEGEG